MTVDPLIGAALIAGIPATYAAYNARAAKKKLEVGGGHGTANSVAHIEDRMEELHETVDRLEAKLDDHISDDHEHMKGD